MLILFITIDFEYLKNYEKSIYRFICWLWGLSLGLEQAGFNPVYVNELNNDALSTYLENRSEYKHLKSKKFHSNDIHELTKNNSIRLRTLTIKNIIINCD